MIFGTIHNMFKPVTPNVSFPELEKKILEYWSKEGIVDEYLHRNDKSEKRFSFLDGPITANNPMGVHHAWGRSYKDLWQRFYNMRGFRQRFQNGFDCQGLWIEVEVEKELGIRNKKDIENLIPGDKKGSIAKFVELCKQRVLKFSKIQTEQSIRLGYFMDWNNSYYTMSDENNYMIWHFLKCCYDKGWIYKGRDSVPWCPRCQTAISQHEMLTEDYKELTHETVFVKLPIVTRGWENTYLLIWTTTPWTVPANVAVALNKKYSYALWQDNTSKEKIIFIAKDELGHTPTRLFKGKSIPIEGYIFEGLKEKSYHKVDELKAEKLIGLKYDAPFDNLPRVQKAKAENPTTFHTVIGGSEIVVATEGTGLLHVAPGAGKEDFDLGKKEKLPVISVISDDASYLDGMEEFSGKNAKKHPELIIDYLKQKDGGKYLLKTMRYTHRYPACWRCKTELVWKVADEWYIAMDRYPLQNQKSVRQLADKNQNHKNENKTLREMMMEVAKKINWIPDFGLERELDWLKNMHDWLISKKNRYWGLALPIYECRKCGKFVVIGSKEELQKRAVSGWREFSGKTPHKPFIDEVKIKCSACGEVVSRIDDVGNVWLDAGIVPFSTYIDPKTKKLSYTSNQKYWREWFPPDFITESFPGQFKNWFYSMIAMSTVLENKKPYKTVLGYASVLGEDGRPMHKSWGNAIDFNEGAEKIGVDVMRWMFATHDPEQNILFGYKKADETRRKFHLLLWNVYNFFVTYANIDKFKIQNSKVKSKNVLDKWIISKLSKLIETVTKSLEKSDSYATSTSIEAFVTDLSQWYVRRSRDRVGPTVERSEDKENCYETLYTVLATLCQLIAPINPFIADEIYQNLTNVDSVHLSNWPKSDKSLIDNVLEKDILLARQIVEQALSIRKAEKLRVRQPLWSLYYTLPQKLPEDIEQLLRDELNIKNLVWEKGQSIKAKIDTDISSHPELIKEGEARELIRQIQIKRKELGLSLTEKVKVILPGFPQEFADQIKRQTLTSELIKGNTLQIIRS